MFSYLRKTLKRFRPSYRMAILSLVFVFVMVGIFGVVFSTKAGVEGGISTVVTAILFWFLMPFYLVIGGLVALTLFLLEIVASYNGFIDSPAVTIGWTVVRDLCNMFFILILLVIAVSTILGIENYHYKKYLKNLLLMAVLINFSKLLTGLMIDLVQVVTLTFIKTFISIGPETLIRAMGLGFILDIAAGRTPTLDGTITGALLGLPMLTIILVVVTIMLLTFLMRIIMIWILIVLSPLAFLLTAAPGGKKYADMWWTEWGKYLIVGPVLAFFLWLSVAVMNTPNLSRGIDTEGRTSTSDAPSAGETKAGTATGFLNFLIGISMLIGGLVVTSKAGLAGASMAGAATGWAKSKAQFIPKAGAGWVDRKGARMYLAGKEQGAGKAKRMAGFLGLALSGSTRKKAYEAHVAEEERKVFPSAQGNFQDVLNERFNPFLGSERVQDWLQKKPGGEKMVGWFGGEKTYHGKIAAEQTMAAKQDEIKKANFDEIRLAEATVGATGEINIGAHLRQVLLENRQNDLCRYIGDENQGKSEEDLSRDIAGYDELDDDGKEFMKGTYSPAGFRDYLRKIKMRGMSEDKKAEMANHLSEYSEANGKVRGFSIGYRDNKGKAHWVDELDSETQGKLDRGEITDTEAEKIRKDKIPGEFNKRARRTDAEKIAGALEACVFRKQFSDTEDNTERDPNIPSIFGNFTEEGEAFFRDLSAAHMESLLKSRKAQARLIQTVGVEEIEGEKMVDTGKLAESYRTNGQATDAILTKAGFSEGEIGRYRAEARAKLVAGGVDMSKIPQLAGVKTPQEKVTEERRKISTQETKLSDLQTEETRLEAETRDKPPETAEEAEASGRYTRTERTGKSKMVGGKWEDVEEEVFDRAAWTRDKEDHGTKTKELEKARGEITKVEATIEGSKVSVANNSSQVVNARLEGLKGQAAGDIDEAALRDLQSDIGDLKTVVGDVAGAIESSLGRSIASEVTDKMDELERDLATKIADGTAESGLSITAIHNISKTVSEYLEEAQKGKKKS